MKKIINICVIVFFVLISLNLADAQQAKKIHRIGFLTKGNGFSYKEAFRQGLREFGYIEGQNISFECRYAKGKNDLLPSLAAELVRLNVNVIVAAGCPAADAAKEATKTIPIVIRTANPVMTGLVPSFAHPGGNITGCTIMTGSEFYSKRLELLKQVAPSASLIGVLWNSDIESHRLSLKGLKATATGFDLTLLPLEAKVPDDIHSAFAKMKKERPGALLNFGDPLFSTYRKQIADFAVENRIPTNFTNAGFVKAGILMSYGPNPVKLNHRMGI
jgi:putative ABC transport system substrate-binding protein